MPAPWAFATSRTTQHKARDGRFTPSLSAREAELLGIAQGIKRAGRGVLQVNSDFGPGEFEALDAAAKLAGRPLSCLLVQVDAQPKLWRETLDQIGAVRRTGRAGQRAGRLQADRRHHGSRDDGSSVRGSSRVARHAQAVAPGALRAVGERRRAAQGADVDTAGSAIPRAFMAEAFHRMFPIGERPDYEPDGKIRSRRSPGARRTPQAVALEEMMSRGGKELLMLPFENYACGSLDVVHEMITDPASVLGIADGGAHVGVICDASSPTSLLTLWGRDRTRGPKLDLEFLIAKQTRGTAEAYGLMDRGLLAPGHKADINVIDFDALTLKRPEVACDLPTGGRRLIQRASGYRYTSHASVETLQNDELTGERPGRLVRGARTAR